MEPASGNIEHRLCCCPSSAITSIGSSSSRVNKSRQRQVSESNKASETFAEQFQPREFCRPVRIATTTTTTRRRRKKPDDISKSSNVHEKRICNLLAICSALILIWATSWSQCQGSSPTSDLSGPNAKPGKAEGELSAFWLADKTSRTIWIPSFKVSWLRPRENEILTAGKFTYIGDPRFTSVNDNGSHDWILEIKDVSLNDSTSYECQVSTDPKMSAIINLHVKAAKARIKQGEQYYTSLGSSIEFSCEIMSQRSYSTSPSTSLQQTYWYHNGNLLNYAKAHLADKNFSIDWDPITQTSRFKLHSVQSADAGNYTCKPSSAEPTSIRLHVKRYNKNGSRDNKANYPNGYHPTAGSKEAQRNRQYFGADSGSLELNDSGAVSDIRSSGSIILQAILIVALIVFLL